MKTTTNKTSKAKSASNAAQPAKAVSTSKKPTRHGQEVNRLLKKLQAYEWDFEAMRA